MRDAERLRFARLGVCIGRVVDSAVGVLPVGIAGGLFGQVEIGFDRLRRRVAIAERLVVFLVGAGFLGTRLLLLHLDQALPIGHRDLVVVRVDFAEREEAVAIAAIFDERRLQAGFDPNDLGEVDVALELPARLGFDVEIFEAVTVQHHDAGFFRVAGVDEKALGHKD